MDKTLLYFIRHGESEANAKKIFAGHTNIDLTSHGHAQAQATAEYLKGIHADVIYSSDLIRAYNTAKHTADIKGIEIIKSEKLREIYAGKWEAVEFDVLETDFADSFGVWLSDIDKAECPDGETVEEMRNRFIGEVKKIAEENLGKTVFIFSHGTPIRSLYSECNGCTLKEAYWATNASVTKIEYKNGKLIMCEYSYDKFLGNMITKLPANV